LKHFLDKEDSVNHRKALNRLDKWITEHIKKSKPAHPFLVVGANKGSDHDRVSNKNQ
jgi:hypothetical protein